MYLIRMLMFLLIFLCLTVTVADRLRYVNPNIQTRKLAACTFDLHVLRVLKLHGINGEVDRVDIVALDDSGMLEGDVKLLEK